MGTWESSGTLETSEFDCRGQNQSSIAKVKTPCIEVFFISLESYRSVYVENGLAWAFGHLQHMLWQKEGSGVKLAIWLSTIKSRELTRPRCVQAECDTPLESSWRELQVCFKPYPNRRSEQIIMTSQNPGSPNRDNFRTLPWESWDKKPFGCRCRGKTQRILYGGRWWLPPSPGHGEYYESKIAHGLS
jgi:hypothetical protein